MKRDVGFNRLNSDNFITKNTSKFLSLTIGALILTLIFSISTISATYNLGTPNYSIEKIYGPSQDITGWLNISFTSESLGSEFEDSRDNVINLSELLKQNPTYNYSCSPAGCGNNYVAVGSGISSTQKFLGVNGNLTYGIKIVGDGFNSILSFSVDIGSDAAESESPQLIIDILGNGESDWVPTIASGTFTENKYYGCYSAPATSSGVVNLYPYSNQIKLSSSPNLKIGATIYALSGGNANFSMEIKEISSGRIGGCSINNVNAGGEIGCIPTASGKNFSITKEGNFSVSIWSAEGSENRYGINYKTNQSCRGSALENFQLFAQPGTYAPLSNIRLNSTEIEKSTGVLGIENKITNYIISRYGGNCGGDGCVIPIKFSSKNSQNVEIENIQVFYKRGAITEFANQVYELGESPAKITSGFKKLYLDQAGFTVPNSIQNYTFSLEFNGNDVLSERLQIMNVPIIQSVTPVSTASAYPTTFTARFSSSYNITRFSWDFGDGTPIITTTGNTGNKTTHIYNQTGAYNLKITATDSRGLSGAKTFSINVSSPRDLIGVNLAELRNSLTAIKQDISVLDSFSKKAINFSLNLAFVESSLNSLQTRYVAATTDTQYNAIVTDLLKLRLPESIFKTRDATDIPLISGPDYVNLDVLKEIAGGSFNSSDEEGYIQGALFWQLENLETQMDYNEFAGRYNGNLEQVVKTFIISVDERTDIGYDYFLIMPELQGFQSDSAFDVKSGYIYVKLDDSETFSFSTTENIDFTNLPAFISPSISRLSLREATPPEEKKTSKWLTFGLVILALLVIGIMVYIILQEWYRRKYEHHLFPNRNDLYNMAHYINNAKKKEMSNSEIEANLKKAGWSAERIRYAMRKYVGKRTGMLEIPIIKAVKKIEERSLGKPGK